MYDVCLSVTSLRLNIPVTHSLRTSLARATHEAIAVEVEDSRTEDDRTSPEIWKTLKQRMKDDKIMMTRNNLCVNTRAIYFAC